MNPTTYQEALEKYAISINCEQDFLKNSVAGSMKKSGKRKANLPWVVFSDPHLPNLRSDLLGSIIAEWSGKANCLVAGDILNLDRCSRWAQTDHKEPDIETLFQARDAFARTLRQHFGKVKMLGGNHDARLWRRASALGADYYWVTQKFFEQMFREVHDVEFIWKPFQKRNGRTIQTAFWEQIGDCVIGHVERSGATPMRGGRLANDFFQKWRDELPIRSWPYRVLLQAHTHKRGYWYDPVTHVHCFETGALCDTPDYAILDHRSDPVQAGYFVLYQSEDGTTDLRRSRLVIL